MRSARLLLVALVACGGAQRPDADPARRLLDRHLRWRGDVGALGVVALEGDADLRGQRARVSLLAGPGGEFRETIDLGGVSTVRTAGPEGAYTLSLSGSVEPLPDHDRAAMRRRLARLTGRGLGEDATAITHLGRRERDGRAWEVVRLDHGDDAVELYLDPASGALAGARVLEDRVWSWEGLDDWTTAGGARVPRVERSFDDDGEPTSQVTWRSIRAGVTPEPGAFARPAPRGLRLSIDGGAASTEPVPFELRNDKILVTGTAQGQPAVFLLDSGAGITVLDQQDADRLGLHKLGEVTLAGTGARQQAALVGPLSARLGALALEGIVAVAVDLSIVRDRAGEALPIILGKELFTSAVVDVDFPRRRVAFHDAARFTPDGRGARLPVVPQADGLVAVELSVEGHPPALFGLDTGGAGALDIFSSYAEATGLLAGRRTSARLGAGVGGAYEEKVARVRTVTLAGQTFTDVPVSFPDVKEGAFATGRLAGNLGAALLSRFRIVFDLPRGVVYLEPGPGEVARPFARDRSGLQLEGVEGALRVLFVAPGSPAEAAGIAAGDRIVAVDGKPVAGTDRAAWRVWQTAPAGTRVELTDDRGRKRLLVLADYF